MQRPGGVDREVEIGAGAAAAPDLAATIQQQLLAASGPIKACQARAPGKAGSAAIKLRIAADGTIGDVTVSSKLGDELDKCVARAVAAIRLAPTGAAGAVNYALAIAFAGKDSAAPPPSATRTNVAGAVTASTSCGIQAAPRRSITTTRLSIAAPIVGVPSAATAIEIPALSRGSVTTRSTCQAAGVHRGGACTSSAGPHAGPASTSTGARASTATPPAGSPPHAATPHNDATRTRPLCLMPNRYHRTDHLTNRLY